MKEGYLDEGISMHGGSEAGGDLWGTAGSSLHAVRDGHSYGEGRGYRLGRGQSWDIFRDIKSDLHFHPVGSKVPSKGFKQKR